VAPPLIAIPGYRLPAGRVGRWISGAVAVPIPYVEALWRAGARVVVLPPGDPGPPPPCDALLLVGGGDVDPVRYGGASHPRVSGVDPERDELELALARQALDTGTPLLAICRGVQVLNVARGGSLHAHLPDLEGLGVHGNEQGEPVHEVVARPGSRLARSCGEQVGSCPSQHHQGLDRVGEGLVATGWTEDGLVEAVEAEDAGAWVLGVQWHPERAAAGDPTHQAVFDAFVAAAAAAHLGR